MGTRGTALRQGGSAVFLADLVGLNNLLEVIVVIYISSCVRDPNE